MSEKNDKLYSGDNLEQKAYAIYTQGGQYAVYAYADALGITDWRWCGPCEDNTPAHDDCCLVCGTPYPPARRAF